jgi:hypothetical protein
MLFSVVVFVSVRVRIIFSHRAADPIFVGPDPDPTPRICRLDPSPIFRYGSDCGCMYSYFGNQLIIVILLHNVVRSSLVIL